MQILDNVNKTVKDDLAATVSKGDKLSIAAACFSIYAYEALKKQLNGVNELRFVFTSPTFLQEKAPKEKREFYIPQFNRERSLYGTEFEVKLRNELTQKAIARECAEWIKKKVRFRSNVTGGTMGSFLSVVKPSETIAYAPLNSFTTSDLGCERGNNIMNLVNRIDAPLAGEYVKIFEQIWNDKNLLRDVTDQVIDGITAAYNENSPEFVYFVAIYNIFNEFLTDISEDVLPNEATGFKETKIWSKLYNFQKDATLAIINKLEKFNGCILADSVGLGKTFTALAVIKYYELRNRNVLVLCPKKLGDNWLTFKENYLNNPIATDRLRYDVLYHTDLSREHGFSGRVDLSKLNWSNYDLVVIDESHNFRNGGEYSGRSDNKRENRYLTLLNKVICQGIKTKVLMLSATPVNNSFSDLRHQLELAYEGDPALINDKLDKLGTSKPIDSIFRNAQTAFNKWSKLDVEERTTENLLRSLDFDFFTMLDNVTIARSRKHIQKYYNTEEIGKFPERMKPLALRPKLTDLPTAIDYDEIYDLLMKLNLAIYIPTDFLLDSRRSKYIDPSVNIDRAGREIGIRRLMCINLLKRLESSVYSFRITLERVRKLIDGTITDIDAYERGNGKIINTQEITDTELDGDDSNADFFENRGKKFDIDLLDMDYVSWRGKLSEDSDILELLSVMIQDISPDHDTKLQTMLNLIAEKVQHPFNEENKKVLIFSAFSDTAEYLYAHIAPFVKERFGLDIAMITGTTDGRTTVKLPHTDMNTILTLFSPLSKDKALLMPNNSAEINILIATDCISEGQNLQDCDYCVNYDIHWNPVRIIQRFGRVDRIGSRNQKIQLVNFWPNIGLDKYLELKGRVETRMKATVMTATGDDNPIDTEEQGDLEYRKAQLERLQNEVVDIEEMQSGVSIMDLGLNEFRLDLLDYVKNHDNLDKVPFGLHAVVKGNDDAPKGTIFILKNRNANINSQNKNQLHPFYMVYVRDGSVVHIDHLQPKKLLDVFRRLCKGKTVPNQELCRQFNTETKDGRNMRHYSELLYFTVKSIVDLNEDDSINSFLSGKQMSLAANTIDGLDDFELVCFVTVK
ncbi:SNF2 family DNA or RNA helicase [Anaerobacterium chartisolvens]|uniref:SNF2 family DNA or RNA helicase n=1 Tax=Anaerobacterium chartisolvens TaxID=1297424 RepID=A0A369BBX4_9FIRM|nr:helicase-related protein [Anaerobacterium chartisolvens]RCX18911.1 SNF2 family DNA or RNA helicase [Anaerobacterium chartisolvens]